MHNAQFLARSANPADGAVPLPPHPQHRRDPPPKQHTDKTPHSMPAHHRGSAALPFPGPRAKPRGCGRGGSGGPEPPARLRPRSAPRVRSAPAAPPGARSGTRSAARGRGSAEAARGGKRGKRGKRGRPRPPRGAEEGAGTAALSPTPDAAAPGQPCPAQDTAGLSAAPFPC